jgi:hypothetical protein
MKKIFLSPFFIIAASLFICICQKAAAQNLIASYPLNGNANDVSGNALNGVINGTLTPVADRNGNANSAMSFPGNGYITIADNPLLRPGSISISCWVKVGSGNLLNSFVDKAIGTCINDSWQFGEINNNFNGYVSNSFSCGDFVSLSAPQSFDNWKFVVYTIDAINHSMSLYADGLQVATGSYAGPIPYDNTPVLIGAAYENGNIAFLLSGGSLDEVKIYDGVLSSAQIATQYFNEVAANKPGSGNAITVDGADDYVQLPSVLDGATQFTIDFWVKTYSTWATGGAYWQKPTLLGNANPALSDGDFGITDNEGKIGVWHGLCCGDQELQTTKVIGDDKWHHVAVVDDGSNMVLYVDGVQLPGSIPTGGGALQNSVRPWRLGMNNSCCNGPVPSQGTFDEMRFWNIPLTQTQIRDRMCKKITNTDPLYNNLAAYYNFDESYGSSIDDKSGHLKYAAIQNGTTRLIGGAPVGNASSHDYVNTVKTASIVHADGENFTVTSSSGNPDGIQVYRVDEQPNTLNGTGSLGAMNKYFGVFQAGGTSPQYTAVYNYTGNPDVTAANENLLALFKRNDNSVINWTDGAATPDATANTLTLTGQSTEYILGRTGIVPLHLLSFSAVKQGEHALLQWQTSDEINTSHFETERSNDALGFKKIGIINAADNSGTHNYNFTDNAPAKGINYYRLKQVDRDGGYTYSPIAKVVFEKDGAALIAFPNPAVNTITIKYTGDQKKIKLSIFDLAGRQVMFKELNNENIWQANVSGLAKGTYTIRLNDGERQSFVKLVKL